EPGLAERLGELPGVALALRGSVAAADDGEGGRAQQLEPAMHVEHGRRVAGLQERSRIGVVGKRDDVMAFGRGPVERARGELAYACRIERLQRRGRQIRSELGALSRQ